MQEREAEALKQKELEQEAKRMAEERRKYTLKVRRRGWGCVGTVTAAAEPGPCRRLSKRRQRRSLRRTSARWQHWMHSIQMMRTMRRSMKPGKYVS